MAEQLISILLCTHFEWEPSLLPLLTQDNCDHCGTVIMITVVQQYCFKLLTLAQLSWLNQCGFFHPPLACALGTLVKTWLGPLFPYSWTSFTCPLALYICGHQSPCTLVGWIELILKNGSVVRKMISANTQRKLRSTFEHFLSQPIQHFGRGEVPRSWGTLRTGTATASTLLLELDKEEWREVAKIPSKRTRMICRRPDEHPSWVEGWGDKGERQGLYSALQCHLAMKSRPATQSELIPETSYRKHNHPRLVIMDVCGHLLM